MKILWKNRNNYTEILGINERNLSYVYSMNPKKYFKLADDKALTLTVLVGTVEQGMLLADSTIPIGRTGKWSVARDISFDWNRANAHGGEEGGGVLVRLLLEEIRGLDSEHLVRLK